MDRLDIERVAGLVVLHYGLPLRVASVSFDQPGRCLVAFSDSYSRAATVSVAIWCDAKVSPHQVRESLKRGLQVND
jgi:hypothetical protein